jgi:tetratricopeptide (TPR) repeat protein
VKDEEKTLPDCLASLRAVVDEVVVYDTGSADGTVELLKRSGARVFEGYWDDDFSRARNACLEECRGEWILAIDADERFACDDIRALRATLERLGQVEIGRLDALLMDIYNYGGKASTLVNCHRAFRLFRKADCCWYGSLHEQVDLRPELIELRAMQGSPLRGAHIDHLGYMDDFMRDHDKLARNLRLAEADLKREPKPGQEGIPQFNLARALAAAGRGEEAADQFKAALALVRVGLQRRAVLLHVVQNLVELGRNEEALRYIVPLKEACKKNDLAYYFEGVARRRLGQVDEAIRLFGQIEDMSSEDGFAFSDSMMRSELAGALVQAGRPEEAADQLVLLIRQNPDVQVMKVAMKVFASTGRPPADLAAAMPADHLDNVGAALVLVPPAEAGPVAEALYLRLGPRPQLLAAATRFAPALPTLQAMEWSARLRAIGMDNACPLLAQARLDNLDPAERVRAAATAHAAFADARGAALAVALAPGVPKDKLPAVLAEMSALDPSLVRDFALAAAGPGAPDAGPVGTPDERYDAVVRALADLGHPELIAQIRNPRSAVGDESARAAQLVAVAADR